MTESDWLDGFILRRLLLMLPGHPDPSERKLRLFGVACARRALDWLPHPTLPAALDACERFADDELTWPALNQVARAVDGVAVHHAGLDTEEDIRASLDLAGAVRELANASGFHADYVADNCRDALCGHDDFYAGRGELLYQADLLRDIFGNPFRPVAFSRERRTSNAVGVAAALYAARDFTDAPILADAIEDAGCDSLELLGHLRDSDAVHVRGCWAVDLVLGKA